MSMSKFKERVCTHLPPYVATIVVEYMPILTNSQAASILVMNKTMYLVSVAARWCPIDIGPAKIETYNAMLCIQKDTSERYEIHCNYAELFRAIKGTRDITSLRNLIGNIAYTAFLNSLDHDLSTVMITGKLTMLTDTDTDEN
jgi:hypothetical protein